MFKNYLKTAWRNLTRHKGFTTINLFGLTIGLTGCMIIALFVWDELQFDKSIPGGQYVYRVYEERNDDGNITYGAPVPPMYATFLEQQYPEVDTTVRILMSLDKFLFEVGQKSAYEEKGWFVESSFFQVFPLKFLKGDASTALNAPNTIVISEDLAKRYFGNEDPINKIVSIDKDTLTVKGVLAKLPKHFHLDFSYLMSLPTAGIEPARMERWTWHQFFTYIKLKPGTDVKQLQQKFQTHVKTVIHPQNNLVGNSYLPFFQHLYDVHLKSADFIYDRAVRGNQSYVKALTIIALFVLAIACFNFINLATARSFKRAKEIGVRKVVGADRKQLVLQFIGETILLSLLSVVVATIAASLLVPVLNNFADKSIEFNPITNPVLALMLLAGGVAIGILAGIYPAMVLSGFQPITVLKNMKLVGSGSHVPWLRQGLVVIQFALSALLIVSAIIVYKQTNYMNNKDLGFNKEQIIYFQLRQGVTERLDAFKQELLQNSGVVSVTSGYGLPGDQFAGDGVIVPGPEGEKEHGTTLFIGDHDYIKTLGLRLIAGRDFSRNMSTDVNEAFIINETAVKEFGFGTPEKALGQRLYWNEWSPADTLNPVKKGKVIGVIQDFHYKSLHEKVSSFVIQLYPQVTFKVAAKLKTADIQGAIAHITNVWNKFSPGYPLDYKFMDDTYGKMYKSEEKLASLLWIFTIMAIVVGCMGLFGLAAFSAEQRVKEIGIRKVLGASVLNIMGLLSKNFVMLVLIASLIAFPIAWWAMNNWLEDFPYRVAISWWVFGIAVVAALLVALITISFQSIKAATTNPVKSLRTE
ncbi:MAG TPA: ABC transporter permease [Chitinophagaceae bacterium]|nr:ABC transporter permease [Chitinophagaceae bacterium]